MGGDGGSVIQRVDMVRTRGYGSSQPASRGGMGYCPNSVRRIEEETVDPKLLRQLGMTNCALTQRPLVKPVVACRAGFLYNKEAVLGRLLEKIMPEKFSLHISSMKDLIDVEFPLVCATTGRDLTEAKAVVFWPCGCLFAQKILSKNSTDCPNCNKPVDLKITLIPTSTERDEQMKQAIALRTRGPQKRPLKQPEEQQPEEHVKRAHPVLAKIFHNAATRVEKTDAFGRGFSSKGVGI